VNTGFTDSTILIIIGGILSIIAAIGKVWLDVLSGNRETAKIHGLVNGQRAEVLNEMAALKRLVAELSGRRDDQVRAEASQVVADEHKAAVAASSEKGKE
jgi:hypothetical protein